MIIGVKCKKKEFLVLMDNLKHCRTLPIHCPTLPEHYHNIARNFNISLDEESAGQKPTAYELKVRSLSKSWISVNSGGFNWFAIFKI